jgi:hypothetical protein
VHEGGYTIEHDRAGGLRFRNRHGLVCQTRPPRPPPGSLDQLLDDHHRLGLEIGRRTNRNGHGDPLELALVVDAIASAVGWEPEVASATLESTKRTPSLSGAASPDDCGSGSVKS